MNRSMMSVAFSFAMVSAAFGVTPTVITVKQDGTGDFTGIVAAVNSIKDSSYKKPYVVQIHEGTYDMISEYFGSEDYTDTTKVGLIVPNYVDLVGIGDKTKIILQSDFPSTIKFRTSTNYSTLNLRGYNNRLENLTVTAYNCRYAVHDQSAALLNEMNYSHVYRDCVFIHKGADPGCTYDTQGITSENESTINTTTRRWGSMHALGQGYNHGAYIYFENCVFDAQGQKGSAFLTHDSNKPLDAEMMPGRVICYECTFHSVQADIFYASSTGSGVKQYVEFYDCTFDENKNFVIAISSLNTAATPGKGRLDYYVSGRGNSPSATIKIPSGYEDHSTITFGEKQGKPTKESEKGPIGWRQTEGVFVGEGDRQKVTSALDMDSGALFVKSGKGSLTIPAGAIGDGSKLFALDGTVVLTRDAVAATDHSTAPACVTDSAALWLSAKSASSVVTESGAVTEWHDVRDTDLENPRYPYARHAVMSTYSDYPQTFGSYLGRDGVFFGGYDARGKGGYQKLVTAAGADLTILHAYEVFYVYGITNSNGTVLSDTTGKGRAFATGSTFIDKPGASSYFYARADSVGASMSARHYRDGARYDPFTEKTVVGTSLFESEFLDRPARFNSLFAGHGSNNTRQGGDYLHEVIVFTNRLTGAERILVKRYLQAKWSLADSASAETVPELALASDAVVELSNDNADAYTNYVRIAYRGEGTVKTTGDNEVALQGTAFNGFNGALEVGSAPVFSRYENFPAVAPKDGECYDVSYRGKRSLYDSTNYQGSAYNGASHSRGALLTKTAGTSGRIEKTGDEALAFAFLPETVTSLKVKGGTLSLRGTIPAHYATAGSDGYKVTFANANCELVQYEAGSVSSMNRVALTNNVWQAGWYHLSDSTHTGSAAILQGRNFTTWGLVAPEGNQAVEMLSPNGSGKKSCIYTRAKFPVAGEYVLSWYEAVGYGRDKGAIGYEVRLARDGDGWAKSTLVATRTASCADYRRVYQKVTVTEPGDYLFGYVLLGPGPNSSYVGFTVDDLRGELQSRTLGDAEEIEIPNGDFEIVTNSKGETGFYTSSTAFIQDTVNFATGWTFYQGDGWSDSGKKAVVGVVETAIPRSSSGDQLIDSKGNASNEFVTAFGGNANVDSFGSVKLFMANRPSDSGPTNTSPGYNVNNYAETTFTVAKKGTYYLRGKLGKWCMSYNGDCYGSSLFNLDPSVRAKVTIGGETTDLGVRTASSVIETDDIWLVPFTVSEDNASVTLRLGQEAIRAIAIIDDLRLVSGDGCLEAESRNLIANGSFEDGSLKFTDSGSVNGVAGWSNSGSVSFWWEKGNGAPYCFAPYDGRVVCSVRNDSYVYRDIGRLAKGRYRFSFATMTRIQGDQSNTIYRDNGVRVYLRKLDGASETGDPIEIVSIPACDTVNPKYEAVEFDLAEDASYRIYVQGTVKKVTVGSITYDRTAVVDGLDLRRIGTEAKTPPAVNEDLSVSVASGAKLDLDYEGTVSISSLRLGGLPVSGDVSAATHPDYITGSGIIHSDGKQNGFTVFVR